MLFSAYGFLCDHEIANSLGLLLICVTKAELV